MAVYATENGNLEVQSSGSNYTVSSQHTRKTPDFCEACSQQPKNAGIVLEIIKPDWIHPNFQKNKTRNPWSLCIVNPDNLLVILDTCPYRLLAMVQDCLGPLARSLVNIQLKPESLPMMVLVADVKGSMTIRNVIQGKLIADRRNSMPDKI